MERQTRQATKEELNNFDAAHSAMYEELSAVLRKYAMTEDELIFWMVIPATTDATIFTQLPFEEQAELLGFIHLQLHAGDMREPRKTQ